MAVGEENSTFAVTQGSDCMQITPLGDGTLSVEEFYDYKVVNDTANYSSLGTEHLQIDRASQLFVYRGSEGVSLVFLIGKIGRRGGYVVTANISGLPPDGEWAVEDDNYPNRDDVFEYNDTSAHIEWNSNGRRTDGAAFRGLGSPNYDTITVDMAFNDETDRYPFDEWWGPPDQNRIERWVVRSGSGETAELDMSRPVELERGTCGDDAPPPTATGNNASTGTAAGTATESAVPTATRPTATRTATPAVATERTTTGLTSTATTPPSGGDGTVDPPPESGESAGQAGDGGESHVAGSGFGPGLALVAPLLLAAGALAGRSE